MSSSPFTKPAISAENSKPELAIAARVLGQNAARHSFELRKNPETSVRQLRAWCKDISVRFAGDAIDAFAAEWQRLTNSWTKEVVEEQQALQCRLPGLNGRRRAASVLK